jgi:beta-phosphoglucomutase
LNDVIHAILWDLDGTIVDTKDCHFFTWESALQKHGFKLDRDTFEMNFGRNNHALAPLFLGFDPDAILLAQLIDHKETLFRQIAPDRQRLSPA